MRLPDAQRLREPALGALVVAGTAIKGAVVGAVVGKLTLGAVAGFAAGLVVVAIVHACPRPRALVLRVPA